MPMTNEGITFTLKVKDDGSMAFDKVSKSIDKVDKAVKKNTKSMINWRKEVVNVNKGLGSLKTQIGILIGTAGFLGLGTAITRLGVTFESTMATVGGVMRATGDDFDALVASARKMGAETEWSATQAAEALQFLGMAGFDTQKAIAALPGTLDLATAGNLDLGRAADIASNALTAMGLQTSDLSRVNDVFIGTITRTNTNMEMMAESFKYAAPVANAFGYEIEQVSAMIGILGNAGIQGSMAGTQLAVALQKVNDVFEKAGMSGSGKDFVDALELIKSEGWSNAEIMTMFGERAGRAALVLKNFTGDIRSLTTTLNEADGEAKTLADRMRNTLGGSFKALRSAIEEDALAIFDTYKVDLKAMVDVTTVWFRDNKEGIVSFVSAIGGAFKFLAEMVSYALKQYKEWAGVVNEMIAGPDTAIGQQHEKLDLINKQIEAQTKFNEVYANRKFPSGVSEEAISRVNEANEIKLNELIEKRTGLITTLGSMKIDNLAAERAASNVAYLEEIARSNNLEEVYKNITTSKLKDADEEAKKAEKIYKDGKAAEKDLAASKLKENEDYLKARATAEKSAWGEVARNIEKRHDWEFDEAEKADKKKAKLKVETHKKALKEIAKAQEDAKKEEEERWKKMLDNMQDITSDVTQQIFDGQIRNFEDFTDVLMGYFKRMLAQMVAEAAMTKIIIPILTSITGGSGGLLGGLAQTAGGSGGGLLSNLFGGSGGSGGGLLSNLGTIGTVGKAGYAGVTGGLGAGVAALSPGLASYLGLTAQSTALTAQFGTPGALAALKGATAGSGAATGMGMGTMAAGFGALAAVVAIGKTIDAFDNIGNAYEERGMVTSNVIQDRLNEFRTDLKVLESVGEDVSNIKLPDFNEMLAKYGQYLEYDDPRLEAVRKSSNYKREMPAGTYWVTPGTDPRDPNIPELGAANLQIESLYTAWAKAKGGAYIDPSQAAAGVDPFGSPMMGTMVPSQGRLRYYAGIYGTRSGQTISPQDVQKQTFATQGINLSNELSSFLSPVEIAEKTAETIEEVIIETFTSKSVFQPFIDAMADSVKQLDLSMAFDKFGDVLEGSEFMKKVQNLSSEIDANVGPVIDDLQRFFFLWQDIDNILHDSVTATAGVQDQVLGIVNTFDVYKEAFADFGLAPDQMAQVQEAQNMQIRELVEQATSAYTTVWDGFVNKIAMSDLAPVTSVQTYLSRYAELKGAATDDPAKYQELLSFVESKYLPFLQGYGGDYSAAFNNVMTDLSGINLEMGSLTDEAASAVRAAMPGAVSVNEAGENILSVTPASFATTLAGAITPAIADIVERPIQITIQIDGETIGNVTAAQLQSNELLLSAVNDLNLGVG